MASTKIDDLPDNLDHPEESFEEEVTEELKEYINSAESENPKKSNFNWSSQFKKYSHFFKNILLVLIFLMLATNNEVQKSIAKFPLIKLQRTDFYFSILVSVFFVLIYAVTNVLLL
jgi:hypothetical protein